MSTEVKTRNRNRVKTESNFIVKEDNRVVVCIMDVDMQFEKSEIWKDVDYTCWNKKAPMVDYFGKFKITAKARCNSEDTFDIETGKRIAESKAKAKAFRIAKNVWKCIAENFVNNAKIAEQMMNNCALAEEIENKHTEKLTE